MDIIAYTGKILSRMMINMEIREDSASPDFFTQKILKLVSFPKEHEVLRIKTSYEVKYLVFRHMGKLVVIGPYLTQFIPNAEMDEEELSKYGISKSQLMEIPVVTEQKILHPVIVTMLDTIWGRENYTWQEYNISIGDALCMYNDNKEYYDAERVSMRYKQESMMLDAVKCCDLGYIDSLTSTIVENWGVEKRNNNAVRNIQNYSIIMNTLLRKTAYEVGVAAIYVDRISSYFGKKIERVSTSLAVSGLMKEMLVEYSLLIKNYSWEGYPESIKKVLFMIDSKFKERLSLEELSKEAGLSPTYLSRLFNKVLGKNISEYIMEIRISKSLEILKNPDATIAEVAVFSGFEDHAYYTRTFRKIKGMTPSEWRSANQSR